MQVVCRGHGHSEVISEGAGEMFVILTMRKGGLWGVTIQLSLALLQPEFALGSRGSPLLGGFEGIPGRLKFIQLEGGLSALTPRSAWLPTRSFTVLLDWTLWLRTLASMARLV